MNDIDSVNFEDLEDGCYQLQQPGSFSEAVQYPAASFDQLYVTKVRLPDGRGNIIYLLTDTFDSSFKMINSKNFIKPPTYRKFFYPAMVYGNFFGRRYRINLTKLRAQRVAQIKSQPLLVPYPTKNLMSTMDNMFFATGDLFEQLTPIMKRYPIKRISMNFWKEFNDILIRLTPEDGKEPRDNKSKHRIMMIDAESFSFKQGAPLDANKANPLFLLYIAFLRTKDLTLLNIDRDMLITSNNMFIKFNPARLTSGKFNKFRNALFRIMKANLDDYTKQLPEDDQAELAISSEDHEVRNIVDKVVAPYTKYNSPSVKGVVANAVDSSIRNNAVVGQAVNDLVTTGQKETIPERRTVSARHKNLFNQVIGNRYEPLTTLTDNNVQVPFRTSPGQQMSPSMRAKQQQLFKSVISDYEPLLTKPDQDIPEEDDDVIEDNEEQLSSDAFDVLTHDKGVAEQIVDEIQDQVMPMTDPRTSPINSARDQKLREEQKKIIVNNSTIEEILSRESSNIPIQSSDKSSVLKTSNPNMKTITFTNFNRTYLDNLYVKDIIACFDSLKDKSSPLYMTSVAIEDTSTTATLKETWTVHFTDENKKSYTVKIDLPKFYENKFMRIKGNKWVILKQNLYNPVVKDVSNMVIITTNKKITVQRKDTKSFSQVERIFSLMRSTKIDTSGIFTSGDCTRVNNRYLSSLEFDELGSRLFKFESPTCVIYFNRDYLQKDILPTFKGTIRGNEYLIGFENKSPLLINEDTGKDALGRTIVDIISDNLSVEQQRVFKGIKPGKQPMYAEGKLRGKWLPVGVILNVWIGITKTLTQMGIQWTFHRGMKNLPSPDSKSIFVKFADGVLEYEAATFAQLIMNGLNKLNLFQFNFSDLDTEKGYVEYIKKEAGTYTFRNQLRTSYEFMMDPISKEVCRDLLLPTEPDLLLIHAVKLLCDNAHENKASDKSYRLRSIETIPAILYNELQDQYHKYSTSGSIKKTFSLPREIVIDKLMELKTQEEYSTLNPATEVGKDHTVSAKGYNGSNADDSYTEEKRSYDPSSIGKIAMSTSPDLNVGISRELVTEPTITNARGYRDTETNDIDTLQDVNIFSPVEMLTPGTAQVDDSIRVAINNSRCRR